MTDLPDSIRAALRDLFHAEPTRVQPVGGGMINPAVRVEVAGTPYFVKWNADALPALFEVEARGLELLRAADAFRIPQVIAYAEASPNAAVQQPAYLILEWIDRVPSVEPRQYAEAFGHALATLHRATWDSFGLDHDNYIGALPQYNPPTGNWAAFYRDQRLVPQIEIARQRGFMPPQRELLVYNLLERVETILEGANNPPSLTHGDLWSGNYFPSAGGKPVLVDPAVFYADREIEIAFTESFGGVAFFLDAYNEVYPLDAGYEFRRPLLQLYTMFVHLNHFGAEYGSYVDAICRHYLL